MKPTALLVRQHDEVSALFATFEESDDHVVQRRLFTEMASRLVAHDRVEREIFYPACAAASLAGEQTLREGIVEHRLVALAILHADSGRDAELRARVAVLMELVEHHVLDEEKEIFPEVERAMSDDILDTLGAAIEARFDASLRDDFRAACRRDVAESVSARDGKSPTRA